MSAQPNLACLQPPPGAPPSCHTAMVGAGVEPVAAVAAVAVWEQCLSALEVAITDKDSCWLPWWGWQWRWWWWFTICSFFLHKTPLLRERLKTEERCSLPDYQHAAKEQLYQGLCFSFLPLHTNVFPAQPSLFATSLIQHHLIFKTTNWSNKGRSERHC